MLPAAAYKPAKHSSGAVLFGQLKWPGIEICHKIVKKKCICEFSQHLQVVLHW